ncbi:MAG: hypothetical protein H0U67_05315 [Gemmatimonadetes bacterium]|nr:hypothetical protein [Gemmatimonadota bacterium]
MSLRLTDLAAMTEQERNRALTTLSTQPSPVGRRIRRYELRIRDEFCRDETTGGGGSEKETADVAAWLFWLNAQPNHVAG